MQELSILNLRHHVRVGAEDCHYDGGMMSGAHMIELATDCAGELSFLQDGVRSLLVCVKEVQILCSVFVGEALDIEMNTVRVGTRSREMEYRIHKTLSKIKGQMTVPQEPVLVSTGRIVVVSGKKA